jgi:hypothetical protein
MERNGKKGKGEENDKTGERGTEGALCFIYHLAVCLITSYE